MVNKPNGLSQSFWQAVLFHKCPHCGGASIYERFLTIRETCTACQFSLKEHDTGDGPAVFVIFITGFVIGILAIITDFVWHPPLWVHLALWPLCVLLLSLLLLRPLKSLFVMLQYRYRLNKNQ